MKGNLFVVSAPSGAGKTTLCRELVLLSARLHYSISYTSREPRAGETQGKHYHFVSRAEFERMVRDGRFIEWAEVYGNLYGTSRDAVERDLNEGDDLLLDVDTRGARQIRDAFPEAILIFILPPSLTELAQRLQKRGQDQPEVIRKRLLEAKNELQEAEIYDYFVVNDDAKEALGLLLSIVAARRAHRVHNRHIVESLLHEEFPAV